MFGILNLNDGIEELSMEKHDKPFLRVLNGEVIDNYIPFWFMRQAGRYLPEYRKLRAEAGSFLDMAYNPQYAAEVTMQPIRRFGMDAAIIFSDILVIPHALGQHLEFVQGEGPKLNPVRCGYDFAKLNFDRFDEILHPVYDALSSVSIALQTEGFDKTALIGFCGAPWTVACYMVEGGGSKDFINTKKLSFEDPDDFQALIDLLVEASAKYLCHKVNAGAEALQIFDSWAGALDANSFDRWCIQPTKEIVKRVRKEHPDVPIIGFPRGAGNHYLDYVKETGVTAVGIDQSISTKWARDYLQSEMPVQGNLDPGCFLAGGNQMVEAAEKIMKDLSGGPFVFNLGHGINKETPIENVELLVETIRNYKNEQKNSRRAV